MPAKKMAEKNEPMIDRFMADQLSRQKKVSIWLYLGIFILISAILAFWGYSAYYSFSAINWNRSTESKIINQTTNNWDEVFKERAQQLEKKEKAMKDIKDLIEKSKTTNIATTTTSTTDTTNTTSTIINTSTNR